MRQNDRKSSRRGFTLVELVIVVLVIGIIAAIAAPKMFDTANNARENATRQSLAVLRDAVELYRTRNGSYPAATSITTDLQPHLQGPFPAPQVGTNQSPTVAASTANPINAVVAGGAGWVYNATTGELRVNDASYLSW